MYPFYEDFERHDYKMQKQREKQQQRQKALERNFDHNIKKQLKSLPDIVFTGDNNQIVDLKVLIDILNGDQKEETMEVYVIRQMLKNQKHQNGIQIKQFAKLFQKQLKDLDLHKEEVQYDNIQNLNRWWNTFKCLDKNIKKQQFQPAQIKYEMSKSQHEKQYTEEQKQMFENRPYWTFNQLQKAFLSKPQ